MTLTSAIVSGCQGEIDTENMKEMVWDAVNVSRRCLLRVFRALNQAYLLVRRIMPSILVRLLIIIFDPDIESGFHVALGTLQ
jgi:hypothetical protein